MDVPIGQTPLATAFCFVEFIVLDWQIVNKFNLKLVSCGTGMFEIYMKAKTCLSCCSREITSICCLTPSQHIIDQSRLINYVDRSKTKVDW